MLTKKTLLYNQKIYFYKKHSKDSILYKISQIVDKENILHNDFIDKKLKKELKGENWIESIYRRNEGFR